MMAKLSAAQRRIREQGPCAVCGGPFAAHRTADAQMGRVSAGEPIDDVAKDYGSSVTEMVTSWMALLTLYADRATHDELE